MNEKNFLLNFIAKCRRRMNASLMLEYAVSAGMIGTIAGVLLEISAFLLPFYYVHWSAAACIVIGILTGIILAAVKRHSMGEAALEIDHFGFKERVITAYENRENEDAVYRMQRADAARILHQNMNCVKIPLLKKPRKAGLFGAAFVLLLVLSMIPSENKERAELLHEIAEKAGEKGEEIAEVVEELEEIDASALTEEQMAALKEMMDSLNMSMTEFDQAASQEALAQAMEKLDFKYEDMAQALSDMYEKLQDNPEALASAESLKKAAENMFQNSGTQVAQGSTISGSENKESSSESSGEGNGDGSGEGGSEGNEGSSGEGNSEGGSSGEGSSGGTGSAEGSGEGSSGSSGESGSGAGSEGSGNSSGAGSGNGTGEGQGGNGGNGNGRGEGSSTAVHDYVSVPNAVGNDENLTGNAGSSYDSDFIRTPNGLAWEGEHVSYESVIGNYTDNAYEGISNGKYPSGMEDVIKDYFGSFNE